MNIADRMRAASLPATADYTETLDTVRRLKESHARLLKCLCELYDRVQRNGGIGPYNGGPAFVMKNAKEAVELAGSIK